MPVWNALFWIIMLFAAITAVGKSFMGESRGRQMYLFTLARPESIILSRILYNMLLMLVLAFLGLFLYSFFLGNPVQNMPMFIFSTMLGCLGLSSVLTLVSAIASRANGSFTLMSILSFPVLIPLLLVIMRSTKLAIDDITISVTWKYLTALGAMNIINLVLAYVLFPYLWRD